MKSRILTLLACTTLISCSYKVTQATTSNNFSKSLLESNETQRKAHILGDAKLFAGEIADSMISINKGSVTVMKNSDIENRFSSYFNSVDYISWDDISAPIIEYSDDKKTAIVHVNKLIDIQAVGDETGKHHYTQFAWSATYKWFDNKWKITSNTSTDKALNEEQAQKLAINNSQLLFDIPEKDLIPEGIAYDESRQTIYLSSTFKQKIISINKQGRVSEFKKESEDELWSTVGMEVDPKSQTLWVVSFNGHEVLPMKNPDPKTHWQSKLYNYDLITGDLINTYQLKTKKQNAFNDLTISDSGLVFVTDSIQNKVYQLNPQLNTFSELEIQLDDFIFPNGVALSDNENYLYISSRNGILEYNLLNNNHNYLISDKDLITTRIDGLEFYKDSLIANQPFKNRILKFTLDANNHKINDQKILEANNPYFDQPTTGVVNGNQFIYLANAQLASGFQEGILRPKHELESIKILKLDL
jgi:hypothetical protein